jgi:CRISPR-associated protein Cmr3
MAIFMIKIKPVEHFFFGTEKVGNLGNRESYYVSTGLYPQQTSLLGLLRHLLLMKENKYGKDFSKDTTVDDLIGPASFPGKNYGKIKLISPVFIVDENKIAYFTRPFDWGFTYVKNQSGCRSSYGEDTEMGYIPYLNGYDSKVEFVDFLVGTNGSCVPIWLDHNKGIGVFTKHVKPGNQKKPGRFLPVMTDLNEKEARNEAYYKQEFLYMNRQYSYACLAEIDCNDLNGFNTLIPFGGERSSFAISIEETGKNGTPAKSVEEWFAMLKPVNQCLKIELISDAFAEQSILGLASFAFCKTVGFRNLKTKNTTENYNRISKDSNNESADFSDQLQLLQKGSVFFFDSNEKLSEAEIILTKGKEDFTQIGYNIFRKFEHKTL